MKCKQVHELISAYLDGELDERTTARVMAHLEKCTACQQVLKDLSAVVDQVSGAPRFDVPARLNEEVMERVERESLYADEWDEKRSVSPRVRWITTAFVAAAGIAFVLGAFQILRHGLKTGRPGLIETLKTKSAAREKADKDVLLAKADKAEEAASEKESTGKPPAPAEVAVRTGAESAGRREETAFRKGAAESVEGAPRAGRGRAVTPKKTESDETVPPVDEWKKKEIETEEEPAKRVPVKHAAPPARVLARRARIHKVAEPDSPGKKAEPLAEVAKDAKAVDGEKVEKVGGLKRTAAALKANEVKKPAIAPPVMAEAAAGRKKGVPQAPRLGVLVGRVLDGDLTAPRELQRAIDNKQIEPRYARDVEGLNRAIVSGALLKNVQYPVSSQLLNAARPDDRAETVVWVVDAARAPAVQTNLMRELGAPLRVRALTYGKGTAWEFENVRREQMDLNAYLASPRKTQTAPVRLEMMTGFAVAGDAKAAAKEKAAASQPTGPVAAKRSLKYAATRPSAPGKAFGVATKPAAALGNIIVVFKSRDETKESK